ncbi:hypothetical protein ABE545_16695 [Sphingobacterium faecium]|jgi:lauroyl/myristoyl acyltransferase|uniref:hypothetical protein n=1 Tax=Sphingobacterium faecium TaxID=34087 RepID=UPI00320BAB2C
MNITELSRCYGRESLALRSVMETMVDPSAMMPTNDYTFFSANMRHFLPVLHWKKHDQLFQEFKLQQGLNALDARYFDREYPLTVKYWDTFLSRILKQNGVIATYHFGAYQLINHLLLKAKVKFALLVAGDVVDSWQDRYPHLMEQMKQGECEQRFVLLNANTYGSLRKTYELLKEGFQLVIYVDGLEGVSKKHNNCIDVPFLGQRISVSTGAASLSFQLGCPIYPLIAFREESHIELRTREPFFPKVNSCKQEYTNWCTTDLFGFLSTYLMHAPAQWSVWPQLQRLLHDEEEVILPFADKNLNLNALNADKFGFLLENHHAGRKTFLMDKETYRLYSLTKEEFGFLSKEWYE